MTSDCSRKHSKSAPLTDAERESKQRQVKTVRIFLDESGFTGEDLFNPEQPVFAVASTDYSDQETTELWGELFSNAKAAEIKHSTLVKTHSGRALSIKLVRRAAKHPKRFTAFAVHKRFSLLAKFVDFWVESVMHRDGVDLYKDGGNIAFANMAYFCIQGFESPEFLNRHLNKFQQMMRERTPEAWVEFWSTFESDRTLAKEQTRDILNAFAFAGAELGFKHLRNLPKKCLDVSFTVALGIIHHWRKLKRKRLSVIHDASSNMAKEKWLWDAITAPDVPAQLVGFDRRTAEFPLGVADTFFADSALCRQLQICDVLAGAVATWASSLTRLGRSDRAEYSEALDNAGIRRVLCGALWPVPEIKRLKARRGTKPVDPFDFYAPIVESAQKKHKP